MNFAGARSNIFRFKGCLNAPKRIVCRRRARGLATAVVHPVGPASSTLDDSDLRSVFDQPSSSVSSTPLHPTGLFGHAELSAPSSFSAIGTRTLARAQLLVARAKRAKNSPSEMRKLVKNMDRLSDLLCGVIDMAELVRYAHPDPNFARAANEVYEHLCSYMNVLNADVELHEVLKIFLSDPSILSSITYGEQQVARLFLYDFEKSGIHLPADLRARCVALNDQIIALGTRFLGEVAEPRPPYDLPREWLDGMPLAERNDILSSSRTSWDRRKVRIEPQSHAHQLIERYAQREEARRAAYMAANVSSEQQIETLERLLSARAELARLVGCGSFAEMTLGNTMAKRPEHVLEFLRTLSEHHRPLAMSDLSQLAAAKEADSHASSSEIHAWDRDYYIPSLASTHAALALPPISPFLSLGTVLQGLSRLFSLLYGVRLRPAPLASGEAWHPDVRKLEVVDETEGTIGYIYADLWARMGKSTGPAHYTVRCSRRVDDDDLIGDIEFARAEGYDIEGLEPELPLRVPSTRMPGRPGIYQLPIIVLMCDVTPPSSGRPSLLTWQGVETLSHEMGHAIHSMLGRTDFHNVAGTRCATDFVELPSILMEHLVASPTAISLLARHHRTGLILPYSQFKRDVAANKTLDVLNAQHQIVLAALDQACHSESAGSASFSSTQEWARVQNTMGVLPYVEGTSWQTQFGHLYSYGGTYYSYIFDRAIASRVFEVVFGGGEGMSREGGERFKNSVLRWGGGREPWECIGEVLGDQAVAEGGKEAMRAVGQWGIASSSVG